MIVEGLSTEASNVPDLPVTYDRYGRMSYHPAFHAKHMTRWSKEDVKYLVENYEGMGPDQLSFALERTIQTVMQKACKLRKLGRMKKPSEKRILHKRTSNMAFRF